MQLRKPTPQLYRFLAAQDVRGMARMKANEQIARKFRYRVHCRPSAESTALNQQTTVATNDFVGASRSTPTPQTMHFSPALPDRIVQLVSSIAVTLPSPNF
jgi:hypothetical protein